MVKAQIQQGVVDCGLFAIANAVSLARKIEPTNVTYVQSQLRAHLINCFQECKMISFPSKLLKVNITVITQFIIIIIHNSQSLICTICLSLYMCGFCL